MAIIKSLKSRVGIDISYHRVLATNINYNDKWIKKINDHKANHRSLNTTEYLNELKTYLGEIIEIKDKYLKDDNNEVQV